MSGTPHGIKIDPKKFEYAMDFAHHSKSSLARALQDSEGHSITLRTLQRSLNTTHEMQYQTLREIAKILDVTPEYLKGEKTPKITGTFQTASILNTNRKGNITVISPKDYENRVDREGYFIPPFQSYVSEEKEATEQQMIFHLSQYINDLISNNMISGIRKLPSGDTEFYDIPASFIREHIDNLHSYLSTSLLDEFFSSWYVALRGKESEDK